MTTLDNGSVETGSPEVSNIAADNGSSAANDANPFDGLQDEGSREWVAKSGVKDIDSLVKNAREAEKLIGRSVQMPGDDASDEDWTAFYEKVNQRVLPKDASGYEFKLPDGVPETMPYDSGFAEQFRGFVHENKVPPHVASALHDWFVSKSAEQYSGGMAEREKQATSATSYLEKDAGWGEAGSPTHKEASEYFFKFVNANGGDDLMSELVSAGVIDEHKQVFMPRVIAALSKAGKMTMAEDKLETGGNSALSRNPFADETSDWGARQKILTSDPQTAKRLIVEAGKNPAVYGLG